MVPMSIKVDSRDVDLTDWGCGSVLNVEAWQIAQLNRLVREGKGAAEHRLRGDDGRECGERDQREQETSGRQQIERIDHGIRLPSQQRALS